MIELKFFENFLPIKTIAEYVFCPRGAVYAYLGWENNLKNSYLYRGTLYQEKMKRNIKKYRKNRLQFKNFLVFSRSLEIYGLCDLVELSKGQVIPVEYKSGKPIINLFHRSQLLLESICLSEMFNLKVDYGYIFFYQTNKRYRINFDQDLKDICLDKLSEFKTIISSPLNALKQIEGCHKLGCSYYYVDQIPKLIYH